jgi:hypothetical protein
MSKYGCLPPPRGMFCHKCEFNRHGINKIELESELKEHYHMAHHMIFKNSPFDTLFSCYSKNWWTEFITSYHSFAIDDNPWVNYMLCSNYDCSTVCKSYKHAKHHFKYEHTKSLNFKEFSSFWLLLKQNAQVNAFSMGFYNYSIRKILLYFADKTRSGLDYIDSDMDYYDAMEQEDKENINTLKEPYAFIF